MSDVLGISAVFEGADKYISDLKRAKAAEEDLVKTAKQVGDEAGDASKGVDKLDNSLDKVGPSANEAADGLNKSKAAAADLQRNITLASAAITGAFVIGLGLAIKSAADFEFKMSQVGAVSGATGEDMKQLSATAKQIGADTAFSASQAADAMQELAAGGRSVAQILGGEARAAVDLAAAGNYGLADSAKVIATAMSVWGDTQLKTNDVVNRLAGAANASVFGVEDMAGAIASGGGVAAQAGVSFADFSTAVAATATAFSSGSDAGTSFKTFVTSLTGNSDKAKEAIAALGLSFYDAQGALKPMSAIVQELHDKVAPLSAEMQTVALKTIFGNDAFRTAAGLMKMTGDEFAAMSKQMGDTDAAAVAKQRMDNLKGSLETLKGSLETLAISIGERVIPMLVQFTGFATKLLNAFGEMSSGTQTLTLFGAAAAAAIPLLVSLASKAIAAGKAIAAMSTQMKLALGAGAFVGALVGLNLALEAFTGKSFLDFFKGAKTAEEEATDQLKKFNKEVEFLDNAGKIRQAATDFGYLTKGSKELDDALKLLRSTSGDLDKLRFGTQGGDEAVEVYRKAQGAATAWGVALKDAQAPLEEIVRIHGELPEELQASFEAGVNWTGILAKIHDDALQGANGLQIFTDEMNRQAGSAEDAAKRNVVAMKTWQDAGSQLATYFEDSWGPALTGAFTNLSDESKAKLGSITAQDFPALNSSAEQVASWLKVKIGEDAASAFSKLADEAEKTHERIVKAVGDLLPDTKKPIEDWVKEMAKAVTDQEAMGSRLEYLYDQLTAAGVAMPEDILRAVAAKGPAFVGEFTSYFQEHPTEALEGLKQIAPILMGESGDSMIDSIKSKKEAMARATQEGVIDPVTGALESSKTTFAGEVEKFVEQGISAGKIHAAKNSPSIGQALADGMADGMSFTARLTAAAVGMVQKALDAAKEKARTGSPSRLFADELGKPLVDGVAMGVEEATPALVETMTDSLQKWQDRLMEGLATGESMSDDQLRQMFVTLYDTVHLGGLGLSEATLSALDTTMAAFVDGMARGEGVANQAVIQWIENVVHMIQAGAPSIAGAIAAATGMLPPVVGTSHPVAVGGKLGGGVVAGEAPEGYYLADTPQGQIYMPIQSTYGPAVLPSGPGTPGFYGAPTDVSVSRAPVSRAGATQATAAITVDLRNSSFTGTPQENASAIETVVSRVVDQRLGRDAMLAGGWR